MSGGKGGRNPLGAIDEFVAQCSIAVKEDSGPGAAKEVVERAVRDQHLLEELPLEADVKILHSAEDLTILHVVMAERPAGAGCPIPHNHMMWALIGVTHGSEENEFFRRSGQTIEPSGRGRVTFCGSFWWRRWCCACSEGPPVSWPGAADRT